MFKHRDSISIVMRLIKQRTRFLKHVFSAPKATHDTIFPHSSSIVIHQSTVCLLKTPSVPEVFALKHFQKVKFPYITILLRLTLHITPAVQAIGTHRHSSRGNRKNELKSNVKSNAHTRLRAIILSELAELEQILHRKECFQEILLPPDSFQSISRLPGFLAPRDPLCTRRKLSSSAAPCG